MQMDNSTQEYTDFTNFTPIFHNIQPWSDSGHVNDYGAPSPPEDPISSQFIKVLKGILFVLCLIENSIALYILCKNVRIRCSKTFFLYMLISVACADILLAIFVYLRTNAAFAHQTEDVVSNALSKMYLTFIQIASNVIALTLVALAWDATRNSSSKGREKHTRKFSAITTIFLWLMATGFSSIYFVFSEVVVNAGGVNPERIWLVYQLDFAFDVTVNLILTILSVVVFFRVRRMKKEMNSLKRSTKIADKSKQKRHERDDDGSELDHSGGWCEEKRNEENTTIYEGLNKSTYKHPPETFSMETNKAIRPTSGSVGDEDAQSTTSQSTRQQEFRETRTEAKILIAISIPLVALSLLSYFMRFLSYSQFTYVSFSAQVAGEIYGIIKPAIYACIDREFRKRYLHLSPFTCCCFRKICRGSLHTGVAAENSHVTQEGGV